MTSPRRAMPGALWLVTSRAVHRLFRLGSGPTTNHLVRYLVAYAFERYGVGLVGMTWMSTTRIWSWWTRRHRALGYRGKLPDRVMLHHVVPEGCGERGRMVHDMEVAVGEAEVRARTEVLASGRGFLARARCVGRSPDEWGTAYEAAGPGTGPEPVLATDAAVRAERIMAWRWFWDASRAALGLWRAGMRSVEFIPGTWPVARLDGARAGPCVA